MQVERVVVGIAGDDGTRAALGALAALCCLGALCAAWRRRRRKARKPSPVVGASGDFSQDNPLLKALTARREADHASGARVGRRRGDAAAPAGPSPSPQPPPAAPAGSALPGAAQDPSSPLRLSEPPVQGPAAALRLAELV